MISSNHHNLVLERRQHANYSVGTKDGASSLGYNIGPEGLIDSSKVEKHTTDLSPSSFTTSGLIDIQVNGFAGVDFNAKGITAERMDHALSYLAASGVTCVLPTLITASQAHLVSQLAELDDAVSQSVLGPLMVAGYHIEGPFLSPEEGSSGAHPASEMIPASQELVIRLEKAASRPLRIMTVAPERQGVLELIPFLVERGIACAIGHTSASRSQIEAAIAAGATLSTHLGNGLPHILNKHENPLFSQLARDELTASFIADGIHVHPDTLQIYLRAKTLDKSIITTDAVAAAGQNLSAGIYTIGSTQIERHEDGSVRIPGSTYLAGSSATMDQMVRNLMRWYGCSMANILQLARTNPAHIVNDFVSTPKVGTKADFVHWEWRNNELQVVETTIGPWLITLQS